jgi:hypothetical protein
MNRTNLARTLAGLLLSAPLMPVLASDIDVIAVTTPTLEFRPTGLSPEVVATSPTITTSHPNLEFNPDTMMRVEELRPGMKGFGLTVFSGIRPERFDAEVIGVRHKSMMAGQDIILVRLSTPRLDGIGVVAGMSGSPVYINGKLIGAVGYGWPGDKVPLAGVTPVEDMLRVLNATQEAQMTPDGPGSSPLGSSSESQRLFETWLQVLNTRSPEPLQRNSRLFAQGEDRLAASEFASLVPDMSLPQADMRPLAAPLHLSSASPSVQRLMPLLFPDRDFVSAGAMGATSSSGGEIVRSTLASPGGPIDLETLAKEIDAGWGLSVPLVDGDFNLSGVGTVSFRHGQRLVAFAHPMWGRGTSAMPAAGARISTIVHSINRPFKLGDSLGQFGMITQDRLPAIGVMVGREAPMFPVNITVDDPQYEGARTFAMRVWKDRDMGANYLLVAIAESIDTVARSSGDAAVDLRYTLEFSDGTRVEKSRFFADPQGGILAALLIGAEVGAMTNNPFKPLQPQSVKVAMRTGYHRAQARLERIRTERSNYKPGDTVLIHFDLVPYRAARQPKTVQLTIPDELPEGTYQILLGDATARQNLQMSLEPAMTRINSFASLVRLVRMNFAENRVYATLTDTDAGASVGSSNLSRLPASVLATLAATTPSEDFAPIRGNLITEHDEPTNFELFGSQILPITVSRKRAE